MHRLLCTSLLLCIAFGTIAQAQHNKYPTVGKITRFDGSKFSGA
jgi:hypothetical protein